MNNFSVKGDKRLFISLLAYGLLSCLALFTYQLRAQYCFSAGDCGGSAITNVTLVGDAGTQINNNSSCTGYSDYTNMQVTMSTGNPYTLTATMPAPSGSTLGAAFIDWNEDGTLDETTEKYQGVFDGLGSITVAITPTPDATSGLKRLRIVTSSSLTINGNLGPFPCDSTVGGETEDYTILFAALGDTIPGCIDKTKAIPANNAPAVCQKTTIRWPRATDAVSYKFSLWEGTTAIETNKSQTDTFYTTASVLTAGAVYRWIALPVSSTGAAGIGCDTLTFTVSPNGDPMANVMPAFQTSVCEGTTQALDGTPTSGTTPYTHNWTGTNVSLLSDVTISNPIFDGNTATGNYNYKYTVTDANGCKGSDSIYINVAPKAIAGTAVAVPKNLCAGNPTTLQVSGYKGVISWETADNVAGPWTSAPLTSLNDSTFTTPALNATTYYRAVVSRGNCTETGNELEIIVNPIPAKPMVSISDASLCQGETATLQTTNYTSDITWNEGTVNSVLQVSTAGIYVAVVNILGCTASSDPVTVAVNPLPAKPQIVLIGNNPACEGEAVAIESNIVGGNTWSPSGLTTDRIDITASGNYTVTQTTSFGCSTQSDVFTMIFNAVPPTPTITVIGTPPFCEGQTIQLSSSSIGGNTWSNNMTSDTIAVTTSGNYTVTVKSANECSATSLEQLVTFNPKPATPAITQQPAGPLCEGTPITLSSSVTGGNNWSTGSSADSIIVSVDETYLLTNTDNNNCVSDAAIFEADFEMVPSKPTFIQDVDTLKASGNGVSYQWFDANGAIAGATSATYQPTASGNYYVVTYSAGGCESVSSDSKWFSGTGILSTRSATVAFTVLPNPNNGVFQVSVDDQSVNELRITDLSGRVVAKQAIGNTVTSVNAALSSGTYLIQLLNNNAVLANQRIVIQ